MSTTKLYKHLISLLILVVSLILVPVSLSGCATVEIPDISPSVTLPASGDGYSRSTLTGKFKRIPKKEWQEQIKRGVVLSSDDWSKLRTVLIKNCLTNPCKQSVGALDDLFIKLDQGLKKVQGL